jgi:excisionase family DNA binding protein
VESTARTNLTTTPRARRDTPGSQAALPIYVSLDEAAQITALSTRTIRRRISDGTIPAYKLGKSSIRIRLDDLEKALRRIPSARMTHGASTSWPAWDIQRDGRATPRAELTRSS